MSNDGNVLGPLKGHHHETYAIPLAPENPLRPYFERGKYREPRREQFRYDRQCFASEDQLLVALQGRISRIPGIAEVEGGFLLQGFIEGRTLGRGRLPSQALSRLHTGQLAQLFGELVSVKGDEFDHLERVCGQASGSPNEFLDRLIEFTEKQVHLKDDGHYVPLFGALGVPEGALSAFRERAGTLADRPFSLVHGDLHRANFIVDLNGNLWTIDWELAMIGDPLYDLATHLHLMRYPAREELRITDVWQAAVERARPGSSDGWQRDLPVLRAYKRAQSLFTDVIRTALTLGPGSEPDRQKLPLSAWRVRRALALAAEPLGMGRVPTLRQVMTAYSEWFRTAGPAAASTVQM
ncbi:aminoglycoside phosphotransferase family protein [Streptomyces sp. NBC_01465]|uniref:aminoglycoside phosphotransferase family protein n=1 Tax=Streptomyces sp. NBC_01465 TaxID=2903878 RepID=UPI002E36F33E|nr:aminoglycoside phosphotransferase family protein [Streptomyces sp. NBC_01465]